MQDFKQFNYIIDIDGLIKANDAGQKIDIIINGEYYDFTNNAKKEGEKNDHI